MNNVNFNKAVQDVFDWNTRAGNDNTSIPYTELWWDKQQKKSELTLSEAQETFDSTLAFDATELLDGVVDVFVTLSGHIQSLIQSGFDVEGAIKAVQKNNDSKFFTDLQSANDDLENLKMYDYEKHKHWYVQHKELNGINYYTLRDENGKIRKPVAFKPVDLSPFVPVRK